MSIENLMIGDYVYNDTKQICKICSIIGIGIPYAEADNLAIDDGCFTLLCDYNGIPLTTEILEKNGWIDNAKFFPNIWSGGGLILQKEDDMFRIVVISDYDDEDNNCTPFIIKYVHELQHALHMRGIKKEIKL